ncbi:MAG: NAD(P)/FAD-dependent oxidoreductase [Myxococcota bacterium]
MATSPHDTFDLLIIGAGFWGMSCFKRARERGIDVGIVDAGFPLDASSASTGVVSANRVDPDDDQFTLLPDGCDADDLLREFGWLEQVGGLEPTRCVKIDVKTGVERDGGQVWLLPDDSDLRALTAISPHRSRFGVRVERLERNTGGQFEASLEGDGTLVADRVIVAVGAWINQMELPVEREVEMEFAVGRGVVFDSMAPLTHKTVQPLKIEVGDQTIFVRRQYGAFRAGSTWEVVGSPDRPGRLPRLQTTAAGRAIFEAIEYLTPRHLVLGEAGGVRPVTPKPIVELWDDDLVVATGGGRTGLALAGLASWRALALLGE